MSDFDQAARYAAKELDAEGFLRWLLPEVWGGWRWAGWLDTQRVAFPGEPERRCDTVAVFERIAGDAPPTAAVVEFQSRPRSDLPERQAEYLLRLRRELPYQREPRVPYEGVAVLLNLTGPEQAETWAMAPADFGGLGLWSRTRVLTLRKTDAVALLGGIAAGQLSNALLAWVPLMERADEAAVVAEWRRLASEEPDARRRSDLGALVRVFAELAGRGDVWGAGLEGWNVERSKALLEMAEPIVAKAVAKATAEAAAKATAEGEARGEARGLSLLREKLLRFLEVHFGGPVPPDVATAVNAQGDLSTLSAWFDGALAAGGMDGVRSTLGLRADTAARIAPFIS